MSRFVAETPIAERPSQKASCPDCGGRKLRSLGTSTTLIGGGDGTLDGDPNHRHEDWQCRDCGARFYRETSHGKVWYTREGKILRGFPNCFESYQYTHHECGGAVLRHYTDMDGTTPARGLSTSITDGKWTRHYRTFFRCEKCAAQIETERDTPETDLGEAPRP